MEAGCGLRAAPPRRACRAARTRSSSTAALAGRPVGQRAHPRRRVVDAFGDERAVDLERAREVLHHRREETLAEGAGGAVGHRVEHRLHAAQPRHVGVLADHAVGAAVVVGAAPPRATARGARCRPCAAAAARARTRASLPSRCRASACSSSAAVVGMHAAAPAGQVVGEFVGLEAEHALPARRQLAPRRWRRPIPTGRPGCRAAPAGSAARPLRRSASAALRARFAALAVRCAAARCAARAAPAAAPAGAAARARCRPRPRRAAPRRPAPRRPAAGPVARPPSPAPGPARARGIGRRVGEHDALPPMACMPAQARSAVGDRRAFGQRQCEATPACPGPACCAAAAASRAGRRCAARSPGRGRPARRPACCRRGWRARSASNGSHAGSAAHAVAGVAHRDRGVLPVAQHLDA